MSKKRSAVKEFLIYMVAAPVMELNRLAPRKIVYAFWEFLSKLFWKLNERRRQIALDNLRSIFESMPAERMEEIGVRSVISMVWMYVEFCWMGGMNRSNVEKSVTFEGWEHLESALKKGKGVMLTSMHIYNGELISGAVAARGMPVNWVIRELDNRFLDKKMDSIRKSCGLKVVKKEKAMHSMIKALRGGEILAFTADQKASTNGVWVKFLGRWSSNHKSPAVLHFRTGAPIVPIFSYPKGDGTHHAYILPELEFKQTGDSKRDIFLLTQKIADLQSEFVRKHPEIWLWMHRKWSVQPNEKDIVESSSFAEEAKMETDLSLIK